MLSIILGRPYTNILLNNVCELSIPNYLMVAIDQSSLLWSTSDKSKKIVWNKTLGDAIRSNRPFPLEPNLPETFKILNHKLKA
uniref:Uncharacterized protein n=1 Tax=Lactuca sativa TaxID=4236 RepID=A0A9R1WYF2_LACSA|nr:hypothetical protein LSAT_V11C800440850 [Lactuca sativa]